jgi:hypothetical protein
MVYILISCFSTIQHFAPSFAKKVANSSMVAKSDENVNTRTNPIANREAHIDSTQSTKSGSPTLSQVTGGGQKKVAIC